MPLNPTSGALVAKQMSQNNSGVYRRANQTYSSLLATYTEDFPVAFALGHLARINPTLNPAPEPARDQRRGFMFATTEALSLTGIKWASLDAPTTCAYAWGYELNLISSRLYQQYPTLFPIAGEDFWRCVYLRHILGAAPFDIIWAQRDTFQPTVYGSLLYAVNNLRRRIPGWNIIHLRMTVFTDCALSYEYAKQGGTLLSEGYGRSPVLSQNNLAGVYN